MPRHGTFHDPARSPAGNCRGHSCRPNSAEVPSVRVLECEKNREGSRRYVVVANEKVGSSETFLDGD